MFSSDSVAAVPFLRLVAVRSLLSAFGELWRSVLGVSANDGQWLSYMAIHRHIIVDIYIYGIYHNFV